MQVDVEHFGLRARRLERDHARAIEPQIEQALVARHGRRHVRPTLQVVANGAVACKEQAVVEHDRIAPLREIEQEQVAPGGLAHEHARAGILGLDDGILAHRAAHHLSEEIARALDAGIGLDLSDRPLHGPRLQGHARAAIEGRNELAAAHIHLRCEPRLLRAPGRNG